jgi:hypothetical protein
VTFGDFKRSRTNTPRTTRSVNVVCVWALVSWIFCETLPAQQRPLKTEDTDLLELGRIRLEFGVEFLQGQRYSLSGLEGALTRVGVASLRFGVGEYADFEVSGVVQDFLSVSRRYPPIIPPDFAGNATSDVGDLVLATRLRFAREGNRRPALGLKFAVQLPNASNEKGLGTDETNFFSSLLLSKRVGRVQLLGNLGLAILGSAVTPGAQADLLTYGLAFVTPVHRRVSVFAEVHGRQGPDRVGNESQSQIRLGAQFFAAGLQWDLAAIAGLKQFDADSGVAVGATYEFQGFHKKRSPRTIK